MLKITSAQNQKIKDAVALKERRAREETGLFLIEGFREITRAVDAKWELHALYICPEFFLGDNENALIAKANCPVFECTAPPFEKLSYRDRPDGLVAIGVQSKRTLSDLKLKKTPFLLVAESIEKPGNLGTILRSADAAGVDAVIVCDPTTDIHNPNVVRSSVGTLFTVPVVEAAGGETLQFLKKNNIALVAATPHAKQEYTSVDLTVPLAIAVGTEQYGLTENWMKQADIQVRIPMQGVADSLNVASATTLLLYEVLRQRKSSFLR
jgi:TrmH family RNA methyltransferase